MPFAAPETDLEVGFKAPDADLWKAPPSDLEPVDTSFDDAQLVPAPADEPVVINENLRQNPLGISTTKGGGRAPLASFAETMVAPVEQFGESLIHKGIPMPKLTINKDDDPLLAAGKEIVNVASSIPEFFTSSLGIGAVAAGAVAPVITAGVFTVDLLYSLGKQAVETYKNWSTMSPAEKSVAVVDMGATGAFAGLTGRHTFKGAKANIGAFKEAIGRDVVEQLPDVPKRFLEPGEELILKDELGEPVEFTNRTAAEVAKKTSTESASSEAVKPPTTTLVEPQAATAELSNFEKSQRINELQTKWDRIQRLPAKEQAELDALKAENKLSQTIAQEKPIETPAPVAEPGVFEKRDAELSAEIDKRGGIEKVSKSDAPSDLKLMEEFQKNQSDWESSVSAEKAKFVSSMSDAEIVKKANEALTNTPPELRPESDAYLAEVEKRGLTGKLKSSFDPGIYDKLRKQYATPQRADVMSALDKTTQFINEGLSQQPGEIGLGSGVGSLIASPRSRAITEDISVRPEELASESPAVESRWQNAKLQKPALIEKGRAALIRIKNAMTRHFPKLDPKTDGAEINILRVHEGAPLVSQYMASNALRGITADLGPKKYGVFERIVILRDLIDYGQKFLTDSKELPFGYESIEAMRSDLKRFEALAEKYPDIGNAVARRNEFMDALRDDLISRKLLHPKVKDFRSYFHHQVLEHMAMKESVAPSTGSSDVRTHTKGWQRKRVGSSKDFNTSYLESEFEVVSQSFAQMMTQDTLKRIEDASDISKSLKAAADKLKEEGRETDWRSLVPDNYTLWQPTRGNHFYWAQSLTEKALESFLRGEKELTKADFDEVLALGGPRKQWAIPKRLAETLDNFGPQKDHAIEKFIGAGQSQWKRWTLFNPMRNLIYEVNNLSGDLDISFAVDPKILSHTPKASKELWNFVIGKKSATPEIDYLVKQGVVDAGFSVHELPDLKGQQFFRVLSGQEPGLITKYWDTVLDFNRWREGVLRYAAFDRALERLNAGDNIYWASKRPEIDAMRKDPNITNQEIAAKLSREAIGDYGNISHAGQWIRSKAVPFYSWMEINAPRYIRLFQNSATDGKARITGVAGKKFAITAAKASALYLLVNLWNKTMFPDEESELNQSQKQLHIILGRRDDGSIASMRFQGAFSDALGWFGGENIIKDVSEIAEGRASVGDKLVESAKAPVNRIAGGSFPIQKTVVESVLGRQTYPDVFNPRQVRDRGRHVAQLASIGTIYDYLTSKPQRPGTWSPLSLVTYSTDPGEAAYYTARSIVSDWMNEHAKDRPETLANDKSNALYYYRQALKYKDEKLAEVWKKKYLALEGTEKGLNQSIARSSPTAALSKKDKASFKSSLSPAENQIMDRADKWYRNTFKPESTPSSTLELRR